MMSFVGPTFRPGVHTFVGPTFRSGIMYSYFCPPCDAGAGLVY